ncbi:MAG: DMT family transporter [Sulfurospirillum sp.]|nr:DMT family transporter [Sulfurospirillum sp.]
MNFKLIFLTTITLFFLSTSSLLGRAALIHNSIDAYSFSFFRLFFGALVLLIILYSKEKKFNLTLTKNWHSSFALFLYAICFSYAYINLEAGLGALILFASVQLTIIVVALIKKERLNFIKSLGIIVSFGGLVYLLYPTQNIEISIYHSILMIISGIAWGFYTIFGRVSSNAVLNTTDNFCKSLFYLAIFFILFIDNLHVSSYGIFLAFISGGITSAIGYLLWYYLLPNIKITTSGILQLLIPPIAIFLGVIFLDENLTLKLIFSATIILSGIYIYLLSRH